ncbi:bifunctional DNA-formamidopyrimidine glycosylase/DNA-(apurinic or apyrimidinic site) lyase [Corynebacterium choanae]|uniref:Formamidopyrimidine-DNA glycosylase n=1 Tax=Corynebacterium choanae TaxID=1862358 RepID=A0A3G6J763_9CORY|nr:bifunctional DNA-formamidopyrimidine glycosylase/DNA-(apurinic or apyrimidinic site) lyase [Corynebacterium choanae]AZA13907.1 Formamidopyrimidine-DNA glycosylase 1 [Corynebacterium choanae]
MPELPEVETVRRGLAAHILGEQIQQVSVYHPRVLRHDDRHPHDVSARLAGLRISGVHRRGKFLWLRFSDQPLLVNHDWTDQFLTTLVGESKIVRASQHIAAQATADRASVRLGSSSSAVLAGQPDGNIAPGIAEDAGGGSQQTVAEVLLVHLGMSGQMLIEDPNRGDDSPFAHHPHRRATMTFTSGRQVHFIDQRTFGYWHLDQAVPSTGAVGRLGVPRRVAHIAPDLCEADLDIDRVAARLKQRGAALKPLLLDQQIIAGIGNIYADEMLWSAQLHPLQSAQRVSHKRLVTLLGCGQTIMRRAIAAGGTSFDDLYVNVNGESGYFDVTLEAYGRTDKPCSRCGTPLTRQVVGGRSSHYCATCQRRY